MVDTLALVVQSEAIFCMSGGKAFQSQTALGKNDIILLAVLQPIVWNLFLVYLYGEFSLLSLRGRHPSISLAGFAISSY